MTGYAARYEELFTGRKVGDAFRRDGSIRPGPGREFVDEVVASEDKFFGCDLTSVSEGGGMRDRCPAVAESVEGRVNDVHGSVISSNLDSCECAAAMDVDEALRSTLRRR